MVVGVVVIIVSPRSPYCPGGGPGPGDAWSVLTAGVIVVIVGRFMSPDVSTSGGSSGAARGPARCVCGYIEVPLHGLVSAVGFHSVPSGMVVSLSRLGFQVDLVVCASVVI